MHIKKLTGETEIFDQDKFCMSLSRAGAPKNLANRVCSIVEQKIKPGASSSNIFREALRYLVKEDLDIAIRYSLKRGINGLGPAGFLFEQYVEAVLRAHGYRTKRNQHLKGRCVSHEIDIIAEKGKQSYLVEVKYRNDDNVTTHINDVMYADARVRDIRISKRSGKKNYQPWMVTNTRFTNSAEKHAKCYGIKLTGWNHPDVDCLENLVLAKKAYPITVIPSVSKFALEQFSQAGMILAQDLLPYSEEDFITSFGLKPAKAKALFKEVQEITN